MGRTLLIDVDTQIADAESLRSALDGYSIASVDGIANTRWSDFSALPFAEALGIDKVNWLFTGDDTPGTLTIRATAETTSNATADDLFCLFPSCEGVTLLDISPANNETSTE